MAASVDEKFGRELKGLRLLVEQTNGAVLAFCLYSDLVTRKYVTDWLTYNSNVPVETLRLPDWKLDLASIIRSFPSVPRLCFSFLDIEAAFPNILGYVNFHREVLLQAGHALIFWIREEGLRRIAEEAPDFWAWRSNVFDFRTAQTVDLGAIGTHDPVIGHYSPSQLAEQAEALEKSGRADLGSLLALGRRQLALGKLEEASKAFERSIGEATRLGDQAGLAEALYLLGNSKLAQGLDQEAGSLYTRSAEFATQVGSTGQLFNSVRLLSAVAQRRGDLDSAFSFAKAVVLISETTDDPAALASAHDQLGNVLFARKDLRGAEMEFQTAAKYEERLSHRSDLAFTLAQLGRVYLEMGDVSQAESTLRKAAALFRENRLESAAADVNELLQSIEAMNS
jgi:tetratricopeptide (TPR) repeat protein